MVAGLDLRLEAFSRPDRERQLDLAVLERARGLEACVVEDAEGGLVAGHHLGDEARDARLAGSSGELLEEARADPRPCSTSATAKAISARAGSRSRA